MTAVGLWIDWDEGLTWGNAHSNLSDLVISATYTRGSAPEITGAAQAGSATFVLKNPGGLFDPDYAAGDLYGKLHDGVPVWFGMNEDGTITTPGTVRGRFAGRIVEVAPLPVAGAGDSTPTAEIICEDALGWYGRTPVALTDTCNPVTPGGCTCSYGTEVIAGITYTTADAFGGRIAIATQFYIPATFFGGSIYPSTATILSGASTGGTQPLILKTEVPNDGNPSGFGLETGVAGAGPRDTVQWVWDLGSVKPICEIGLMANGNIGPQTTVIGSDDGVTWTTILTNAEINPALQYSLVPVSASARYVGLFYDWPTTPAFDYFPGIDYTGFLVWTCI